MDFNSEREPLLNKDDDDLEMKVDKQLLSINKKSEKQILNKSCSCSNIFENIFCCCIDYDLTNRQYNLYIDLRNIVSIPYNQEDPNHEAKLKEFFDNLKEVFPDEEEDIKENINDSNTISTNINTEANDKNSEIKTLAKKIGFQNNNPRTDFRAGGLNSLEFMNYFVIHHKVELKNNIIKEKYFNFVLASINLSFCIRLVLYLTNIINVETTLKSYNLQGFTRKQIKHFSEQLERESTTKDDFLFELMSQCLLFVFKKYQSEIEYDKKDENFVKINSIIKEAIYYLGDTLNHTNKNENLEEKLIHKLAGELIGKNLK